MTKYYLKSGPFGPIAGLCILILLATRAFEAQPLLAEGFYVSPASVYTVTNSKNEEFDCTSLNGKIVVGVFNAESGVFDPLKDKMRKLKGRLSDAVGSARAKLARAVEKFKSKMSRGLLACKSGGTTATPTPVPNATATPIGSGGSGNNCFVGTETTCFSIPLGYVGNFSRGATLHSNYCQGCHNQKSGSNYYDVSAACQQANSTMSSICGNFSVQNFADLTAYLNW